MTVGLFDARKKAPLTVSVDDFGAVGDGVTDDRAAIQDAITAGEAQGVPVQFTTGRTYATDFNLVASAPVTLTGYGATIRARSGATALRLSSSNVTVEGLTIVGNGATQFTASERGILSLGTQESPFTGCRIVDVTIRDMGDTAIRADWWTDAVIERSTLANLTYAGIIAQSCKRVRISGVTVRDVWRHDADQSYGISITDSVNTVEGRSQDVTVEDCTVENIPHWTALSTHGGERVAFLRNRVTGCFRGIVFGAGNPSRIVAATDGVVVGNRVDGVEVGSSVAFAVIGQPTGAESTAYRAKNIVVNHSRQYEATSNGRWLDTPPTFYEVSEGAMPVLKAFSDGQWVPLLAGRDGAQGPPGPASPHEGSHIAVSVRQYGAVGDGTTDDTAAVQAAINAAGSYGFVDFEAGTYKVTSGLSSWLNIRKTGPGVLTDGTVEQYISPRWDGDLLILHVDGDNGSDLADGMFPHSAFKTLTRLREAFEKMDQEQVQRGRVIVRLSGTITGGMRFQNLPVAKNFIRFEGELVGENTRPATWIVNDTSDGERFGLRFEEGQNQRVHLANIGFRGFNTGGGAGWIMKSGGFIRTEDCWTEDCQIGSLYTGNVGFSEQRSTHEGYTTSGTRAQYNASGTWTEVKCLGGPAAFEGFHISRNAVAHVDYCTSENHTVYGGWQDMSTRVSWKCSTFRNNGSRGIRAEGGSDCHIDMTIPHNVFENNGKQGVSIRGTARLAAEEGIYAIPEHLVDSRFFTARTTALEADRGLRAYRIGADARMRLRAWGDSAGTLTVTGGGSTFGAITVPAGNWAVELVAQHDGGVWQTYATVNGGAPIFGTATAGTTDILPTFTPSGGATLRGIEVRTGG